MSPLNKLTESQLAYLAGIIDGEGCIRIARTPHGRPIVRVHVTNTDARLTTLLKDWCGGYVWSETKQSMPNAKFRYAWEVGSRRAGRVLTLVLPFLVLKKERAELALAIQATKVARTTPTAAVSEFQEAMARRIRVLNKKGVA